MLAFLIWVMVMGIAGTIHDSAQAQSPEPTQPQPARTESRPVMDEELTRLVANIEAAGIDWVNGNPQSFAEQSSQTADFSIFGPFGGPASVGWANYAAVAPRIASLFKGGSSQIDVASAYRSGDLAVIVQVERQMVQFAGDEAPQPWNLRVTQVFRRENGEWRVVHRHADPLLAMRSPEEVKELARK